MSHATHHSRRLRPDKNIIRSDKYSSDFQILQIFLLIFKFPAEQKFSGFNFALL